jgi:hypothetical protein
MLSKTNNNYYKPNHLVDDWGFYIDLESIQPIPNNEEKIRQKYKVKKYYSIYDKYNEYCNDVCDEYSYYMKNNNNRDDDYSIDVSMIDTNTELIKDNTEKNNKNVNNIIVRVSSTTIITAFLTYVIFFVL